MKVELDNESFMDGPKFGLCEILQETMDDLDMGEVSRSVKDANGNTVGRWDIADESEPDNELLESLEAALGWLLSDERCLNTEFPTFNETISTAKKAILKAKGG